MPGNFPPSWRESVYWKVAAVLVGIQIITGIFAVGLSAWFAYNQSLDLVANSLRLRLDSAAEEVEQRTEFEPTEITHLTPGLYYDLPRRFDDPIYLIDENGEIINQVTAQDSPFGSMSPTGGRQQSIDSTIAWEGLGTLLQRGDIIVQVDEDSPHGTWGLAPLFNFDGSLAGGLLVKPLTMSIQRELSPTRKAFVRALFVIIGVSGLLALVLGGVFTWWLIRPLRQMTNKVAAIGAGDYSVRMETTGQDEFGRLATAINQMAGEVSASIESLKATDKMRRELITNVGHDLRTPLAAILGYTEEAERHLAEQNREVAREALESARHQGDYLKRLVEDLFELSRFISGPPSLREEPVPVAELLHQVARSHRKSIEDDGVRFQLDVPSDLPVISGDGLRLMRVLNNLISNAKRHTSAGDRIDLQAYAKNGVVTVQVCDTGEGMSEEERQNIFERYYRGGDARTRKDNRTGLGLAISQAIIEAHGGTIAVESERGEGSTFSIQLPVNNHG